VSAIITLLRPYLLQIGAVALAVALVIGGYWYIRHQGAVAERKEQELAALKDSLAIVLAQSAKNDAIAKDLEKRLADSAVKQHELNGRLKNEIAKNTVYRQCRVPDDGVHLLRDARESVSPSPR